MAMETCPGLGTSLEAQHLTLLDPDNPAFLEIFGSHLER